MTMGMLDGELAEDANGEIEIWKAPREGHQYAIGVDTSEGLVGGDYACGQILDMNDLEQVGIVHGTISPWDFAQLLNKLGRWYNNAIVNIEVKSSGWAVQDYML